jgi:hypothetical protein
MHHHHPAQKIPINQMVERDRIHTRSTREKKKKKRQTWKKKKKKKVLAYDGGRSEGWEKKQRPVSCSSHMFCVPF